MKKQEGYNPAQPNAHLSSELAEFNYKNLVGDNFKEYNDFVDTLRKPGDSASPDALRLYDFIQVRVKPVMVDRYPGLPNTPRDMVGIELKKGIGPVSVTRIDFRMADILNSQITNEAAIVDGNAIYFLLQRPGDTFEDFAE